ncbi:MAG: metallophosphoesterase [Sporichthyaceae bacterium]|nr:metallophosphoesterase [Sporichthyaceae bacterium]
MSGRPVGERWDWLRGGAGSRRRRGWLVAEVAVVGLVGCWLGLLAGGRVGAAVGPLQAELSIAPSLRGGSEVAIPPLGRLLVDTHDGPWHLTTEVVRINAADARRIFADPAAVNGLGERVTADLRSGLVDVIVRSTVAATVGALVLGVMVFRRRWRPALAAGAVSLSAIVGGGAVAAATWNPASINQPRYQGLLASAPTVVGDAQDIVADFAKYEGQLAKLVTNVSRLYDVTSALPAYRPDSSTIRLLFVSDLHINPAAWNVIRSITDQFDVDLIVDAGDISDHGTAAENAYLDPIATLGVPYVWVRGNHDSAITQAAVASQPNGVVLDGQPQVVAGLRFLGAGDPRFTPDNSTDEVAPASVSQVGLGLASTAQRLASAGEPVDMVVIHDGDAASEIDGSVPLVLSGHHHERTQVRLPGGTVQFEQGTTGGSGLRALQRNGKPKSITASVLYIDRETRSLQAWDDITLGGLGVVSATIERRILAEQLPEPEPAVSPVSQ